MTLKNDPAAYKRHSKYLSYVLRHNPSAIGLTLGEGGWVLIDDLLSGLAAGSHAMTRELLEDIVRSNDKQRFSLSEDGLRIRAAQGHSVEVELDLAPVPPPETLYHGTATRFLDAILTEGLKPMSRRHVHLSKDIETATKVGVRHGKLVILVVKSGAMHARGTPFYQADNGVWLTDRVEPEDFEILTP